MPPILLTEDAKIMCDSIPALPLVRYKYILIYRVYSEFARFSA
jgi:hypothetical protein